MSNSNTSTTSSSAQFVPEHNIPEHNIPERDMTRHTEAQHASTIDMGLNRMSQSARSSMERLNLNENFNHLTSSKTNLNGFQQQQQQQQNRNQVLSSIDYNSNYGINRLGVGETHYGSVNNLATNNYMTINQPPSFTATQRTLYLQQQRSIANRTGYYSASSSTLQPMTQHDEVLFVHPVQQHHQQQQHQHNYYQTYEDTSKDEIIERLKAKLALADQEIYQLSNTNSGFVNRLEELQGWSNEVRSKISQREELKVQLRNMELRLK
jgi:hypothetical protein